MSCSSFIHLVQASLTHYCQPVSQRCSWFSSFSAHQNEIDSYVVVHIMQLRLHGYFYIFFPCSDRNSNFLSAAQRSEATNQTSSGGLDQDRAVEPYRNSVGNNTSEDPRLLSNSSSLPSSQATLPSHQNGASERGEQTLHDAMRHKYLDGDQSSGMSRKPSGEQIAAEAGVRSQFSTPSSRSLSPTRYLHHVLTPLKCFPSLYVCIFFA